MFRPATILHRLPRALPTLRTSPRRFLHSTPSARSEAPGPGLTNLFSTTPSLQVQSLSPENGITLTDGLVIPGACIFLDGRVFLWDAPCAGAPFNWGREWERWGKELCDVWEVVVPRPEILLVGTGDKALPPPPWFRKRLNELGIQVDVLDTRNAASTYNLLSEEGRNVGAALMPVVEYKWPRSYSSSFSSSSDS